jgi:hypothetical protein
MHTTDLHVAVINLVDLHVHAAWNLLLFFIYINLV